MKSVLKIGLLILSGVLVLTLAACDEGDTEEQALQPEAVVREYYHGLSNQDLEALKALQVERRPALIYRQVVEGLKKAELISIKENEEEKEAFIQSERGQYYKPENIRVFEVEAEFDYQQYASLYYQRGKQKRVYFVVREKEDSPWLIDEIGRI